MAMESLVASVYEYAREKTEKWHFLYHVKRSIFPLIIGIFVLSGLLFSSTVAYFVFYWSYIPSAGIVKDVHLQFTYHTLKIEVSDSIVKMQLLGQLSTLQALIS